MLLKPVSLSISYGKAAALPETLLLPPLAKKEMPGRELA